MWSTFITSQMETRELSKLFNEFVASYSSDDGRGASARRNTVDTRDAIRAATLQDEQDLIQSLLDSLEIDDSIRRMLTINMSTSAVSRERVVPSYQD